MGFLDNLATGYQRGQAQFVANEAARVEAAEKQAKAAREAAEFRLKLEQHSQALMNSAETEYNAIINEIGGEHWDPSKIPTIMPRVKNFDQTYGRIWKGGRLSDEVQKMLHMDQEIGSVPDGQQGPQPAGGGRSPLWGYASPEQFEAAEERRQASRLREMAPELMDGAREAISAQNGTFLDPVTGYTNLYKWQDSVIQAGYDPLAVDKIMDTVREQMALVYSSMADLEGKGDQLRTKKDAVGKEASSWVTSILQMDKDDGSVDFQNMFTKRTPLRLEMERTAQQMAEMGESLGSIKARMIMKYRNKLGELNLDISETPYVGSLSLAGAPDEALGQVTRFYDLNVSDDEDFYDPMWGDGQMWLVNRYEPNKSVQVWPQAGSPLVQGQMGTTGYGAPAGAPKQAPAAATAPSQTQAPEAAPREVTVALRNGAAERAAAADQRKAEQDARARQKASDRAERDAKRQAEAATMAAQRAVSDRNNRAFRLFRSGKITQEQFQEELRRSKAGEPSLIAETL